MEAVREEPYDKAVKMYLEGRRLSEITTETGVPRSAVYWALRQRGIVPSRTVRNKGGEENMTISQVLEQLNAANREIGRLKAIIEQLKQ